MAVAASGLVCRLRMRPFAGTIRPVSVILTKHQPLKIRFFLQNRVSEQMAPLIKTEF